MNGPGIEESTTVTPARPLPAATLPTYPRVKRCERLVGGYAVYYIEDFDGSILPPGLRQSEPGDEEMHVAAELALIAQEIRNRPRLELVKPDHDHPSRLYPAVWSRLLRPATSRSRGSLPPR